MTSDKINLFASVGTWLSLSCQTTVSYLSEPSALFTYLIITNVIHKVTQKSDNIFIILMLMSILSTSLHDVPELHRRRVTACGGDLARQEETEEPAPGQEPGPKD